MKFIKINIFILLIGICLVNIECGKKTEEGFRITIVTKALDSEFWQNLKQGAEDEAKNHADASVTVLAPQREINIDQQVNILEDQILKNVSALVVAPCGVAEIIPALNKAYEKNIPVLTVDTDVDWSHRLSYIGTDNRLGGKLAGEYLIKGLNGRGKIAIIRGIPGVQTHEDRVGGFLEAIKTAPGIEMVALQPANSERDLALTVMENLLTSHPDLDGVFITSDQMALGALEAIDAHRLIGKIVTVGFDAGEEAIKAVKDGKMIAVVAQDPYNMGKQSFLAALKAAKGETIEKRIDTGTKVIDKSNVDEFK
jgi:ribose transport system substrate-binding protein